MEEKKYVPLLQDVDPELRSTMIEVNEYKVTGADFKDANVLDIGANIGLFTALALDGGAKRVVSFEPDGENFDQLVAVFREDKRVHLHDFAVGGKVRTGFMSGHGSHARLSTEIVDIIGEAETAVRVVPLSAIVSNSFPTKEDILLKMDVEGSEYEILYNTPDETFARFKSIHIEIHGTPPYTPQDVKFLKEYIAQKGFTLTSEMIPKKWNTGEDGRRYNIEDLPVSVCRFDRDVAGVPEKVTPGEEAMSVTATVCTRNRYDTTFPLCLMAIATQTRVPEELIIYDDNVEAKRRDLRDDPTYQCILILLTHRNIDWKVVYGTGAGQVKNHQHAFENALHPFIWRLDDDDIPNPNVMEELCNAMASTVGAVGGLIPFVRGMQAMPQNASNRIEDIFLGLNEQWFFPPTDDLRSVDHLNSSFLYRRSASKGYNMTLSRVAHREETMLTYDIKRAGWDVVINSKAITWHFHNPEGGIRDDSRKQMWEHDEEIFKEYLREHGVLVPKVFTAVINAGLGDTFMFLSTLKKIIEKYKAYKSYKIMLYVCYPDVFKDIDDPNVVLLSIADAIQAGIDMDKHNLYKVAMDRNWKGNLSELYEKMYL